MPIEVEATVLPLLSVERIAFEILENHVVPRVVSVFDALVKLLRPVQELLLASNVEDAALIVIFDDPSKETPLIVRAFCSVVAVFALPLIEPAMMLVKV